MPSLAIPVSGLSLGSSHSSATSPARDVDIFNLTLSDIVIEDMIKCVRGKNALQLSLGNGPKFIFGSQKIHLTSAHEPFTCEYFRTAVAPQSSQTATSTKMTAKPGRSIFWGSSKAKLTQTIRIEGIPKVPKSSHSTTAAKTNTPRIEATAATDAALSQLQNSLALANAQKKSNTTKQVKDNSTLPPQVQQRGSAQPVKSGNKARFLAQNTSSKGAAATRSVPVSPYLSGVGSPSPALTSVPLSQQQAEKTKAIRRPIIHMLATGPIAEGDIYKAKKPGISDEEFQLSLGKVADLNNGEWKLSNKSYKDLDVWSYSKYSREQRQRAIDNAVRAYDKLRLSASSPEWDKLLPEEERGRGKSLSKIQAGITTGTIKPAKGPKIRVHGTDDSGRETGAEEMGDDLFGDKAAGGEPMARSHSNPPAAKSKKVGEKEAQAKRLLGRPAKARPATSKPEKKVAESSKVKSSKFVSESEEAEDDYLVDPPVKSTTKPPTSKPGRVAAPAPKPSNKRARDESDEITHARVRKTMKTAGTSPHKSSPLSSPPTNASSDIEDSSSSAPARPLKRKPTDYIEVPSAKRHQHSTSGSTSSSVASSAGSGTGSSSSGVNGTNGVRAPDYTKVKKAETSTRLFAAYYAQYKKMYEKVQASYPKNAEEYADLMDMHERLLTMKGEILRKNGL